MGIFLRPQAVGGVETFLGLTDTPLNYVGQGGLAVTVNVAENALEFTDSFVRIAGDTMTGALEVQDNIRIRGNNELRFYDNGNFVGFEAPALAADQIWVLPAVDGAAGEALATDGGGVLSWGADHGALTGLDPDDDHSQYIFNSPAASARNVITPTAGTVIPLSIEGAAGQSANLTTWQDSLGAPLAEMDKLGNLLLNAPGAPLGGGLTAGALNARLANSAGTVVGYILYATPGGEPGIVFFDETKASGKRYQLTYFAAKDHLTISADTLSQTRVGIGTFSGDPIGVLGVYSNIVSVVTLAVRAAGGQLANIVEVQHVNPSFPPLWFVARDGGQSIQQAVVTTGTPTSSLLITSAAHTALTASTERHEVHWDFSATQQLATGPLPLQRTVLVEPATYSAVGATVITDATTLTISGAPIAGANVTLTRTAAFVVASGNVVFGAASTAKTLLTVDGHISLTSNNEVRWYDNGNYVGFEAPALTGNQIWVLPVSDGNDGDVMFTDGSGNLKWGANASTRAFTFSSPSGGSGTIYAAGHYRFGASDNDFNPGINFGTADAAYGDHIFIVAAAGGAGGTDTVIRVAGTSITDEGVRTTTDTEDLTADDAGLAGAYYETVKKWIGLVTITKQSGPDLLCNYGGTKYWDDNNENFKVEGVEATWLGGGNDANPNLLLRHHKATGWTYNNGSTPTPPAAIAAMNADYVTEIKVVNGEEGAWKRTNLSVNIEGSGEEGVIIEIITTANKSFEIGNFLIRVVPQ